MNLKRIKDNYTGWDEVTGGPNRIPCGVVNSEHTMFKPYLGNYIGGEEFQDRFGEFPYESTSEVDKGLEILSQEWGIDKSKLKIGQNESFPYGFVYYEDKTLGEPVDIDPDWVLNIDGELVLASEDYEDESAVYLIAEELDFDSRLWWYPAAIDE